MARTKQTRRTNRTFLVPTTYQERERNNGVVEVAPPSNDDSIKRKRKELRDEAILFVGRDRGILPTKLDSSNATSKEVASNKRRKAPPPPSPSLPPFDDWKKESLESFNERVFYLLGGHEYRDGDVEERIWSVIQREYLERFVTKKESRRLVDLGKIIKLLHSWDRLEGGVVDILETCLEIVRKWEELQGLELTGTGRSEETGSYGHVTALSGICGEIRAVISRVKENLPPRSSSSSKKGSTVIPKKYKSWAEKNWDAYEDGNKTMKKCAVFLLIQEILSYRGFHQKFFSSSSSSSSSLVTSSTSSTTARTKNRNKNKTYPPESPARYDFLKVGVPSDVARDMGMSEAEASPYPYSYISKDCKNLLEEYVTPLNYEDMQIWLNVSEDWITNSVPQSNRRAITFQMSFKGSVLPCDKQDLRAEKGFLECFEETTEEENVGSWNCDIGSVPVGSVLFEMGPRKLLEKELLGGWDGLLEGFSEDFTGRRTEPSYVSWHPDALLFRKYKYEYEEGGELVLLVHNIVEDGVKAILGQSLASNRITYSECQIIIQPQVSMKILQIEKELRTIQGNPSGGIRTHETLPKNPEDSRKYRVIQTEIRLP